MNNKKIFRERFESKVKKKKGCWDWIGSIDVYGYGYISALGTKFKAHRVSYELFNKKIPEGLVIDHLCRNRLCTNPDHLEAVTIGENVKRGYCLKDFCLHGHKMTEENTGKRKAYGKLYSYCRECRRIQVNKRNRLSTP